MWQQGNKYRWKNKQWQFKDVRPGAALPFSNRFSTAQNSVTIICWIGNGNLWISQRTSSSIPMAEIFLIQKSKAMCSESDRFFSSSETILWHAPDKFYWKYYSQGERLISICIRFKSEENAIGDKAEVCCCLKILE